MVSIEHLHFSYESREQASLEDVHLNIDQGEFVLLAGESGSGKSTLLKTIAGIIPGYQQGRMQGRVHTHGLDTSQQKLHHLSRKTGILFQNPDSQFFNLSVEDEISFGMLNRGWDMDRIQLRLEETIEGFGLQKVRKLPPTHLSEGQKQRTVLASILATDPALVLLDEPFAHLDERQSSTLIELLMKLNKGGTTMIIAEHRLGKLIPVANRALVMQEGSVVHDLAPEKLRNAAFCASLGLREFSNESFEARPVHNNRASCLIGVEQGNIAYRGGFTLDVEAFYAEPGKKVALLGPNGSGKTSLLRILSGLKKLKNGSTIPRKIKPGKHSTLVYQQTDNQLFMDTVEKEVLRFSDQPEKARELLDYFGLSRYRNVSPFSLSEGEKQRVVLAASLSRGVPVLLLDEPTTGMDGKQLKRFIELLSDELMKERSCIIATHDHQLIRQGTQEHYIIAH